MTDEEILLAKKNLKMNI